MSVYRITSIQRSGPTGETGHITRVWCHKDGRTALGDAKIWTVAQVDAHVEKSHKFYTFGRVSLKAAEVEPFDEVLNGRTIRSLRSASDATPENNLEKLPIVKKQPPAQSLLRRTGKAPSQQTRYQRATPGTPTGSPTTSPTQ